MSIPSCTRLILLNQNIIANGRQNQLLGKIHISPWEADMARKATEDSEIRFAKYVDELTSVIGHADRAAPLRDYCVGLVAAEGRKRVEPMAAVTAPAGVSAQYQKLLHFVAESPWSTSRCWPKCASWCCRQSSGVGRSRPGSSMIHLSPSRAAIRSECIISTAGNWVSRPIVRWR